MTEKNINQKPAEEQSADWPINHVAKFFKKFNAYDRGKERKDKRIYDYEQDIEEEENFK